MSTARNPSGVSAVQWRSTMSRLVVTLVILAVLLFVPAGNTFLDDNRKKLCPGHFVELFFDASGRVGANPELDRDHPMRVLRFYYPRILQYVPDKKTLEEWSKIQFDLAGYETMIRQERKRDVCHVLPPEEKKTAF